MISHSASADRQVMSGFIEEDAPYGPLWGLKGLSAIDGVLMSHVDNSTRDYS